MDSQQPERQLLSPKGTSIETTKVQQTVDILLDKSSDHTRKQKNAMFEALQKAHFRFPTEVGRIVSDRLNTHGVDKHTPREMLFIAQQYERAEKTLTVEGIKALLLLDPEKLAARLVEFDKSNDMSAPAVIRQAINELLRLSLANDVLFSKAATRVVETIKKDLRYFLGPQALELAYELERNGTDPHRSLVKLIVELGAGVPSEWVRFKGMLKGKESSDRRDVDPSISPTVERDVEALVKILLQGTILSGRIRIAEMAAAASGNQRLLDALLVMTYSNLSKIRNLASNVIPELLRANPELVQARCSVIMQQYDPGLLGKGKNITTAPVIAYAVLLDGKNRECVKRSEAILERFVKPFGVSSVQDLLRPDREISPLEFNVLRANTEKRNVRMLGRFESGSPEFDKCLKEHLQGLDDDNAIKVLTVCGKGGKQQATLVLSRNKATITDVRGSKEAPRSQEEQRFLDGIQFSLARVHQNINRFVDVTQETVTLDLPGHSPDHCRNMFGAWLVDTANRDVRFQRLVDNRVKVFKHREVFQSRKLELANIDLKERDRRHREELVDGSKKDLKPSRMVQDMGKELNQMPDVTKGLESRRLRTQVTAQAFGRLWGKPRSS